MNPTSDNAQQGQEMAIFSTSGAPADAMIFMIENKIMYQVLLGAYTHTNGTKVEREVSYLIDSSNIDTITQSGLIDDQESILLLTSLGVYKDDTGKSIVARRAEILMRETMERTAIGVLKPVPMTEALKASAWTYNPIINGFFIVVPNELEIPKMEEPQDVSEGV